MNYDHMNNFSVTHGVVYAQTICHTNGVFTSRRFHGYIAFTKAIEFRGQIHLASVVYCFQLFLRRKIYPTYYLPFPCKSVALDFFPLAIHRNYPVKRPGSASIFVTSSECRHPQQRPRTQEYTLEPIQCAKRNGIFLGRLIGRAEGRQVR